MFNYVIKIASATKAFFLLRFLASVLIGVIYFVIAANIQYLFVTLLGKNTFNYIIGGIISLMLGSFLCYYVGYVVFAFIRGWHMAAIAYHKQITRRRLSSLDAGFTIFTKYFTTFAAVYGLGVLIRKESKAAANKLWDLLDDVPYLSSLSRVSQHPLVQLIAEDILDTAFDAIVFYNIKYGKPGLVSNLSSLTSIMKNYLFALPSTVVGSLTSLILFYAVPKIAGVAIFFYCLLTSGLAMSIMSVVVSFPVLYLLRHTVFEPLEKIILISGFADYCAEHESDKSADKENSSVIGNIVDEILDNMGFPLEEEDGCQGQDIDEESDSKEQQSCKEEDNKNTFENIEQEQEDENSSESTSKPTCSSTRSRMEQRTSTMSSTGESEDSNSSPNVDVVSRPRPLNDLSRLAEQISAATREAASANNRKFSVSDIDSNYEEGASMHTDDGDKSDNEYVFNYGNQGTEIPEEALNVHVDVDNYGSDEDTQELTNANMLNNLARMGRAIYQNVNSDDFDSALNGGDLND